MAIMLNVKVIPASEYKPNDCRAHVIANIEGHAREVLSFYDDELSFSADEFEGQDESIVGPLFTKKDIAYLQS